MTSAAVLNMAGKRTAVDKPIKPTPAFEWLEERPRPEWFVRIRSSDGRVRWFVRFTMTGLATRQYGPFANKRRCLRFLNDALKRLWFDGVAELDEAQSDHCMKSREFEPPGYAYPVLEHTIALYAKHLPSKGA